MLEATYFNGWHYGTMASSLQEGVNIGVFNPEGYDCLRESSNFDKSITVIGFYVKCPDKIRMIRQLNRETDPDVEEICRRFFSDREDFEPLEENNAGLHEIKNVTPQDVHDAVLYIQQFVDGMGLSN